MTPGVRRRISEVQSQASATSQLRLLDGLPQDIAISCCQFVGPDDLPHLVANRRLWLLIGMDDVWHFFCQVRWGPSANLHVYSRARNLYLDRNGWFPMRKGKRRRPHFKVNHLQLYETPCLTMDLRITEREIIAVSEAISGPSGRPASVQIIDSTTHELLESLTVSNATINCCDMQEGRFCLGSDDSVVRLYSRAERYRLAGEYVCASEVNDLRLAREDYIVAVRTHQNRHPAGLDLIPVSRPDARVSYPGGSWITHGKYIHALDGFEDQQCSLGSIVCSGEHPLTSAFSVMLFDFRLAQPCVVDLDVAIARQGYPQDTMLWPLRAGCYPKVYANLLHESRERTEGAVAMMDFRFPKAEVCCRFVLPSQVDDFRCLGDSLYASCTAYADGSDAQCLRVLRCTESDPTLSETVVEISGSYDAAGRSPREDLKVFSLCAHGFAVSYGQKLALGAVAELQDAGEEPVYLQAPAGLSSTFIGEA